MIVNNKNGDTLAAAFSKILNKSLKKKASQEGQGAGEMILEEFEGKGKDEEFSDVSFLRDPSEGHSASDAEALSNSIEDSVSMLSGPEDHEKEYERSIGGLVELGDSEPKSIEASKNIMRGLGKIARSLSGKGETFASDMVIAAAHEINEEILKEAAKVTFVKNELMKIASELEVEGDNFSRDMVIATAKSL